MLLGAAPAAGFVDDDVGVAEAPPPRGGDVFLVIDSHGLHRLHGFVVGADWGPGTLLLHG